MIGQSAHQRHVRLKHIRLNPQLRQVGQHEHLKLRPDPFRQHGMLLDDHAGERRPDRQVRRPRSLGDRVALLQVGGRQPEHHQVRERHVVVRLGLGQLQLAEPALVLHLEAKLLDDGGVAGGGRLGLGLDLPQVRLRNRHARIPQRQQLASQLVAPGVGGQQLLPPVADRLVGHLLFDVGQGRLDLEQLQQLGRVRGDDTGAGGVLTLRQQRRLRLHDLQLGVAKLPAVDHRQHVAGVHRLADADLHVADDTVGRREDVGQAVLVAGDPARTPGAMVERLGRDRRHLDARAGPFVGREGDLVGLGLTLLLFLLGLFPRSKEQPPGHDPADEAEDQQRDAGDHDLPAGRHGCGRLQGGRRGMLRGVWGHGGTRQKQWGKRISHPRPSSTGRRQEIQNGIDSDYETRTPASRREAKCERRGGASPGGVEGGWNSSTRTVTNSATTGDCSSSRRALKSSPASPTVMPPAESQCD